MRLYVDTSALLKTIHPEPQTPALLAFLTAQTARGCILATSSLTAVEAERGLRAAADRLGLTLTRPPAQFVDRAMQGLTELPVAAPVIRMARWLGPPLLRSLDAIHLASALLDGADGVITYDQRLAQAATGVNLAIHAPA
jgi:predicted nucleic acid-binding protein